MKLLEQLFSRQEFVLCDPSTDKSGLPEKTFKRLNTLKTIELLLEYVKCSQHELVISYSTHRVGNLPLDILLCKG